MSPEVTRRKIAKIVAYLGELEEYRDITFEDYLAHRRAVERILILLIQAATDLVSHLLADRGVVQPDSYREVFEAAAQSGLLDRALAQSLGRAVGLRNILVHEYEQIDDRLVWESIPVALEDFTAFLSAMRKAVE